MLIMKRLMISSSGNFYFTCCIVWFSMPNGSIGLETACLESSYSCSTISKWYSGLRNKLKFWKTIKLFYCWVLNIRANIKLDELSLLSSILSRPSSLWWPPHRPCLWRQPPSFFYLLFSFDLFKIRWRRSLFLFSLLVTTTKIWIGRSGSFSSPPHELSWRRRTC